MRTTDTCALVGFSTVSRSFAPWNDESVTIFGINEEYNFPYFKRKEKNLVWFQLHKRDSFTRLNNQNDPHHFSWLTKEHNFPIYMQQKWDDIPASIAFPKEEINTLLNSWTSHSGATFRNYFTSTLAYLLGFAALEGYKRIEIYGFELASGTEYIRQRMCAMFLIGLLRGRGIEIYVPPVSKLLRGYGSYAYDDTMLGMRQELEFMANRGDAELDKSMEEAYGSLGKAQALAEISTIHPEEKELAEKEQQIAAEQLKALYIKQGWIKGLRSSVEIYDRYIELDREKADGA